MNKKTRALTEEQYRKIITTINEGFVTAAGERVKPNSRIATALTLEANLGLRISDILHLTINQIVKDGDRYRLDLVEQKTGKKREFTVPTEIYIYIQNYALENNINPRARLFQITERTVQRHLKMVCDYLEYEYISTHSFRKFFASSIYKDTEIMEFIKALDLIEENIFISLDARWGEGKTFYVRQIEKTLEYQTLKNFETDDNKNKYEEMKPYFEKTVLEDIELGNSYLPVYYNAWLYDNHSDPLMSLLYVIIKKCGLWIDSKLVKDKTDKLKDIIKSIQVNLGIFSINGDKVIDAVSEKNIFDGIQLAEDIRQRVKEIFNQVIEGQTQKLVIFIDELDRCKPSYALEMLERIKHYFDDNRIIFIVSVNKEQLTHTISNYYGNGFDSTGYLNKFFDVNAYLPEVERRQLRFVSEYSERSIFGRMANMYANYYKLTLRDALIYKERLSIIDTTENSYVIDDDSIEGVCISIFVPLIVILDMVDIKEKVSFIDGKSRVLRQMEGYQELERVYRRLGWRVPEEQCVSEGKRIVDAVYQYAFNNSKEALESANLATGTFRRDLKSQCKKLCGAIKDNR